MIDFENGWGLNSVGDGLTLGKIAYDKKGDRYLADVCYPFSVKNAVEIMMKKKEFDIIKDNDMTLSGFLYQYGQLKKEMQELLDKTINEKL